jgi:hypothetical protein
MCVRAINCAHISAKKEVEISVPEDGLFIHVYINIRKRELLRCNAIFDSVGIYEIRIYVEMK